MKNVSLTKSRNRYPHRVHNQRQSEQGLPSLCSPIAVNIFVLAGEVQDNEHGSKRSPHVCSDITYHEGSFIDGLQLC